MARTKLHRLRLLTAETVTLRRHVKACQVRQRTGFHPPLTQMPTPEETNEGEEKTKENEATGPTRNSTTDEGIVANHVEGETRSKQRERRRTQRG